MYYIYILYSEFLDRYYVGSTQDISRRLDEHNRGKGGYTRQGKEWVLKYTETFESRQEAVNRENAIKKRKSRQYIQDLINSVDS